MGLKIDLETQRLVFIHIPKCGGTSVNAAMKRAFGDAYYRVPPGSRDLTVPDDAAAVSGHFRFKGISTQTGREKRYFSILREPGERFLSFYRDIRTRASHPYKAEAVAMGPVEFAKFALNGTGDLVDVQCRFLSADGSPSFEAAKENIISNGMHIVSAARTDRLIRQLLRIYGKSMETAEERRNVSPRGDFTDEEKDQTISFVRRRSKEDVKLFKWLRDAEREASAKRRQAGTG